MEDMVSTAMVGATEADLDSMVISAMVVDTEADMKAWEDMVITAMVEATEADIEAIAGSREFGEGYGGYFLDIW